MKSMLLIVLVLTVLGCVERKSSIPVLPETVVGTEINSQEPRFVFVAPDGFDWNDEHRIWHNKSTRTSITLAHEPGTSLQSVDDEFVSDRMIASGMELINKETRDVDGRPTLLVKGNRMNGRYPQEFCTVAFGTIAGCAQITAIYPTDTRDQMKKQIEASLLESRYETPK
jgi:hypothetical protein